MIKANVKSSYLVTKEILSRMIIYTFLPEMYIFRLAIGSYSTATMFVVHTGLLERPNITYTKRDTKFFAVTLC